MNKWNIIASISAIVPIALIKENYVLGGAQLAGNQVVLSNNPGLGIEGFSLGLTFVCKIS